MTRKYEIRPCNATLLALMVTCASGAATAAQQLGPSNSDTSWIEVASNGCAGSSECVGTGSGSLAYDDYVPGITSELAGGEVQPGRVLGRAAGNSGANPFTYVSAFDTYTLGGFSGSVTLGVQVHVVGVVRSVSQNGQHFISVGGYSVKVGGWNTASDAAEQFRVGGDVINSGRSVRNQPVQATPFSVAIDDTFFGTLTVSGGTPFVLAMALQTGGGSADNDFHTDGAALSFTALPTGAFLTSTRGYTQGVLPPPPPNPVPLPASWTMLPLALVLTRWRRAQSRA